LVSVVSALDINQTVIAEVFPESIYLEIFSPQQNFIYDSRQVLVNLSLGEEVAFFKLSDNGSPLRSLCRRCSTYERYKPFDDGFHEVLIFVSNSKQENIIRKVNFTVDSRDPRIRKTYPRRGLTNGIISIVFQEENPEHLNLTLRNNSGYSRSADIDLDNCIKERRNTECIVELNLSKFNNQEIHYWFNLTDITGKGDISRPRSIEVDVSKPAINSFNFLVDRRKVKFHFNITEENFDQINYIDWESKNPREKRLCSRIKNGICEKRKRFSKGDHNLTIFVYDEAENLREITDILFNIS
jgi:hypothetical protein